MKAVRSKAYFKSQVLDSTGIALVEFKAKWSGTCQILQPVYEELSRMYAGSACFYTVDVEEEPRIHPEFGVLELPTILFFQNGFLIDHAVGLASKDLLIAKIEQALSSG